MQTTQRAGQLDVLEHVCPYGALWWRQRPCWHIMRRLIPTCMVPAWCLLCQSSTCTIYLLQLAGAYCLPWGRPNAVITTLYNAVAVVLVPRGHRLIVDTT